MKKLCEGCKKLFYKQPSDSKKYWLKKRFCSIECSGTTFKKGHKPKHIDKLRSVYGKDHHLWKGGRSITNRGYMEIKVNKKRYLEHRYVMEQHLGRKLQRHEHVHHVNGDKLDNRLENLKLMSREEHNKMHTEERWRADKPFRKGLVAHG